MQEMVCRRCANIAGDNYCRAFKKKTSPYRCCRLFKKKAVQDIEVAAVNEIKNETKNEQIIKATFKEIESVVRCINSYSPKWVSFERIKKDTGFDGKSKDLKYYLKKIEGIEYTVIGSLPLWRIKQ